jgi:hypothetical protein
MSCATGAGAYAEPKLTHSLFAHYAQQGVSLSVFSIVTNSMNDFYIQSIGFQRAKGIIGLINLVYDKYFGFLCRDFS